MNEEVKERTPQKFFPKYLAEGAKLPMPEFFSAVFLIAFQGSKILAIQNDRGWDVPGGHIEAGESPEAALVREVMEEGGATFQSAKLFAFIESTNQAEYKDKVMLMYATDTLELGEFTPSEDAFGRELVEVDEFLSRYHGRVGFWPELISRAKQSLQK